MRRLFRMSDSGRHARQDEGTAEQHVSAEGGSIVASDTSPAKSDSSRFKTFGEGLKLKFHKKPKDKVEVRMFTVCIPRVYPADLMIKG